jgi:predicted transposase YdaD
MRDVLGKAQARYAAEIACERLLAAEEAKARAKARGEARGEARGKAEEETDVARSIAKRCLAMGVDPAVVADATGLDVSELAGLASSS